MTHQRLSVFLCLALGSTLALALGGCDSIPDSVTQRFTPVAPQSRVVDNPEKAVFVAAQETLKRMDFTVTRSAQAQGIVDGISERKDSAVYGASRQLTLEVRLRGLSDGNTEVNVLAHEQVEGDFKAGATSVGVRTAGIYDLYYNILAQVLKESASTVASPATPATPAAAAR